MDSHDSKVAVVGCGLIGKSYIMLFASAGYDVTIYDIEAQQVTAALNIIQQQLGELSEQGLLKGRLSHIEQFNKIHAADNLEECVRGAFYIQECVPESLEIKKSVWGQIDQMVDGTVIMATSTSALQPSVISEGLKHRNRFIVSHPTNPPYFCPATEVVPAKWTDAEVTSKTMALLKKAGLVPILVKKEVFGFAMNRLQAAIVGAAYSLVQEGVVSPEDCDLLMSEGLGHRYPFMGPWGSAHMHANGIDSYEERYADTIHKIQASYSPEKMGGETMQRIKASMERLMGPVEKLNERRAWRDRRLVSLAKLKADMDKEDSTE